MEPVSAILGAIIAGASFALHETSAVAVREAYRGVKTILVDTYNFLSFPLIEKNTRSLAYRASLEEELIAHQEVLNDSTLLVAIEQLTKSLLSVPKEKAAVYGIEVEDLTAFDSVVLERISSIKARTIEAKSGSVFISDVGNRQGN